MRAGAVGGGGSAESKRDRLPELLPFPFAHHSSQGLQPAPGCWLCTAVHSCLQLFTRAVSSPDAPEPDLYPGIAVRVGR